jgi:shikimate dehydrogenase
MHMAEAQQHGLTYVYRVIDTGEQHLTDDALRHLLDGVRLLGFDGLNVTFPYKQRIIPLLDGLGPTAERLGAVNTVLVNDGRLEGHNTDVTGFALALEHHLNGVSLQSVVQLGAGGAGAAVSDALLGLGTAELVLVERDLERAEALAASLTERFEDRTVVAVSHAAVAEVLPRAAGVVNCTPTGMAHHPGVPLDPGLLREDLWVADIVYRPLATELLRHAVDRGCHVMHGGYMAVYQAARTFELITGRAADPDRMLRHLESLAATGPEDHDVALD